MRRRRRGQFNIMVKASNTFKLVVASFAIGVFSYVVKLPPLLPISKETKTSLGYPKESLLNVTERAVRHGFLASEHSVLTEDGYVLNMFRLQQPGEVRGPPVLLMHGLLQSAASWLDAGPNAGLAYLLAAAGFDLWLGNARGTHYSRKHAWLNPDKDKKYWDFCVDEIGKYDVPALIDHILQQTEATKINYIGFSQGAGTFFIMCSERPEYCDKVGVMIGLAPAARQTHTKSVLYRILTESFMRFEGILSSLGIGEVFSKGALSQEFLAFFCQLSGLTAKICETGKDLLDSSISLHLGSIKNDTIRTLFGNFPAGTSVHNMARYGQSMTSPHFQKFDYGKEHNLVLYSSKHPPQYNLSAVTVPVVAIYGRNDGLVDTSDVSWLLKKLPNVLETVEVKDPLWNHLDVTYSQFTGVMILPKIEEYLFKYNSTKSWKS